MSDSCDRDPSRPHRLSSMQPWRAGIGGLAVALFATACGGTNDDVKKRLAALQDQLTTVQNANDRLEERVAALELVGTARSANGARPAGEPGLLARPPLKVVKVEPSPAASGSTESDESPPPDAAAAVAASAPDDDDAARPLIRGSGEKLEARNVTGAPTAGKNSPRAKPSALEQTH